MLRLLRHADRTLLRRGAPSWSPLRGRKIELTLGDL
jgi:hypothetical protein